MFKDIQELPIGDRFSRLVLPRGDWFESSSIESFLLKVIPQFNQLGFDFDGGDELINICRAEKLTYYVTTTESARGISGLKTEYPQHAGMVMLGRRASIEEPRLKLAALVMLCVDDWRDHLSGSNPLSENMATFERRLAEVWRMLRLASAEAFDLIPPIRLDPEEFHDRLELNLEALDPRVEAQWGRDVDYLRLLQRFFNYYLGGGSHYTRSGRGNGQQKSERESQAVSLAPRDRESDIQGESTHDQTLVTREPTPRLRKSNHFQSGNSPDEIEDGPRLVQSQQMISCFRGGSPAQAVIRLKHRQIHQRRNAQILPARWSVLTDFELRMFGLALSSGGDIDDAVKTALWLVLLTGRPLDTVLSARVVRRAEQIPENLNSHTLYLITDSAEWVVGVLRPEDRRKTRNEWHQVLEQHEHRIILPFPVPIWERISRLVTPRGDGAIKRSAKLFSKDTLSTVRERTRGLVTEINRAKKLRLTLSRVEYHLTEALHRVSGDLVEATLLTGRQPPFGPSAALYYHHRDRRSLVDDYIKVTDCWCKWIFSQPALDSPKQKHLIDGRVGSDLVPRTETVSGLFRALREQVAYDQRLLGSHDGLRIFHNSLTNYALMMLLWLTGYRAVQDPIAQLSDFNAHRRLLVIADKTGDGYGHSRIIPVCSVLFDQLEAYSRHADWLRNRLDLMGRVRSTGVFFYLDENLNEVPIRPASIQEFLEWAYILPLNLNRHWLRGNLREKNVPGPHVDRFMGHWGMGQEPWGRFSGVDPHGFHQALEAALDSLSQELGLTVVEGVA